MLCSPHHRVFVCHMVGADAPEIVQGLAVALQCGATQAQFNATITSTQPPPKSS